MSRNLSDADAPRSDQTDSGPNGTVHGALSRIPQLQRLLESPHAIALMRERGRAPTVAALRAQLQRVRDALRSQAAAGAASPLLGTNDSGDTALPDFFSPAFFAETGRALRADGAVGAPRVINATGVVVHTNLGRAPLAAEAIEAMHAAAERCCALEVDAATGERGVRHARAAERLCRLTGAQAALVVNNGAAAVMLILAALARGGEVIVSRGELVEVGGGFRIPDVIAQGGARLVEVGSTNRTRAADYAAAIGEATRVLLACHPSNYRIVGFTARPARAELAALARARGLVFAEDLGSGALVDPALFGLPSEPTVRQCLDEGADLVAFSGDKLLGGPQAGIVAGRADLVAALERHPLMRALRVDKLRLAALEATLALYEREAVPREAVPVLRMLSEDVRSVRRRAQRLARGLRALPGLQIGIEAGRSVPGGGALPDATLPTALVTVQAAHRSAEALAARLRSATPALFGRVADGRFTMDLRTVRADEVGEIVALFAALGN